MIIVTLVSAYDLIVSQGFPNSDWPTVSSWVPTWDWWAWVILILALVLIAVVEGSYRLYVKNPQVVSGKAIQNHEKTISRLASLVREADKLSIISARNNSEGVEAAIQEAVKWTVKVIGEAEVRISPVRRQQLRLEAGLPSEGDIKEADFDVPFPHLTSESRLKLIWERHYRVRNWIRSYVEDAQSTPDKEGSQTE